MTEVLRYAAFTAQGRGGNPAGVVLDATGLSDDEMLRIAAEVGYSETAFLTEHRGSDHYRVRYFAPLQEVPFCGHATIATGVALAERGAGESMVFETNAGPVAVHTRSADGEIVAELTSVAPSSEAADEELVVAALGALRWRRDELDSGYPIEVADAGARHLVLVTRTRERLADLDYDFEALAVLMRARRLITLQLIWPETAERYHSRNPFPPGGVIEDPATGAAAAALGGYLRKHSKVAHDATFTISQRVDMGRPSEITVRMSADDPGVRVSGAAHPIV
ncbi:MAG TPA: PhzF family phenazine biosynthesis isomerase [Microlunatus sp.]|nr:PhzF family phenazine biosynthesis isomerase [Microlunatus sp.]